MGASVDRKRTNKQLLIYLCLNAAFESPSTNSGTNSGSGQLRLATNFRWLRLSKPRKISADPSALSLCVLCAIAVKSLQLPLPVSYYTHPVTPGLLPFCCFNAAFEGLRQRVLGDRFIVVFENPSTGSGTTSDSG